MSVLPYHTEDPGSREVGPILGTLIPFPARHRDGEVAARLGVPRFQGPPEKSRLRHAAHSHPPLFSEHSATAVGQLWGVILLKLRDSLSGGSPIIALG